nr:unnamed protein product [Callosobruchus chinensis]
MGSGISHEVKTVEVVVAGEQQPAALAERNAGDAANDVVVAVHGQLLVGPDIEQPTVRVTAQNPDCKSNRPISVVELERRRLATAASLSKDVEAITAWGLRNMVEFNASKTQYCTLSNKRCPSDHSVLMNNQALPRSHSFKLLGVSITENMIWHEHVSPIATATGKKLGYLFRARKYFSASNLLKLYKAQIRPSLEYCSHIWGAAAPTTLSILDAVQRRAIRLIGDPALTCHLQPLSHRRAVGDRSSELTSIIPPLSKPARWTRGTSSSHPKAVVLHTSRTERYDRTFIPKVSRAWNGLPGDVLDEQARVGLFKSRVNKLPLT